ncbi:MAG: hypothetical protein JO001_20350 [Alphaproteobacteria bacterium]|nr:hypothetical protein [Alphaproteobacteria bacterium]
MRGLLPVLLLLSVAACDDVAGPAAVPQTQVQVGFPSNGLTDTIHVQAIDQRPLRAAVLVAPDGTTTPASTLNVSAQPELATGQRQANNPYQSALLGGSDSSAAFVAPHPQAMAALQSSEQLLAMGSTADIPLPDPVAYRRDWLRYRVRLTFGIPPNAETGDIAAPAPPPAGP